MAAMITSMDDAIGRILQTIDDGGIRENTFVWFISDNGGIKEFPASNRPLRGHKRQLFEGGIRVPACVRWPQGFAGGREVAVPTAYIDVLPTLMEVAGVDDHAGEPLDGFGLLGALKGGQSPALRDLYFYEGQDGRQNEQVAVITPQWKLIIIGKDVSYGVTGEHNVMLFDINEDPYEDRNIAAEHPDIVAELTDRLIVYRKLQPVDAVPPFNQGRAGFAAPKDWRIPGE